MIHLGDFPASHTAVCIPFDSFAAATGASSAASSFVAGDVLIYKDGGTTQRSSSSGITVSTSFDSQTGLQMIVIDLSDNTDAGFYAAGHEYQVGVADITIDGQTVRFWAATFSIERAGGILALLKATGSVKVDVSKWNSTTVATPATAGIPDVNVKNIDNDTASASGTVTFPNATLASTTNITAGTITTTTNLTNLPAAAALEATSQAIKAKTDNLPNAVRMTGAVVSNIANDSTSFDTDLAETETDHWKDAFLTFTSGTLEGQTRRITAYNGSTKFVTCGAYSAEPSAGDTFDIVNV